VYTHTHTHTQDVLQHFWVVLSQTRTQRTRGMILYDVCIYIIHYGVQLDPRMLVDMYPAPHMKHMYPPPHYRVQLDPRMLVWEYEGSKTLEV
jgi:hypothetical protein